nr:hypothetical protein [Verrucosispora sioxanthis]
MPRWRTRCARRRHALTGLASRGDAGHGAAAPGAARRCTAPESVEPYLVLARRTADRAVAAGRLRPVDAAALFGVLDDYRSGVVA